MLPLHWPNIAIQPALCGRLRCDAQWRRERPASLRLTDHELWLIWAGKGNMQTHAGDFVLRTGFCVWMRPGGIYDAQTHPRDRLGITYIHFDLHTCKRGRQQKLDAATSAQREFFHLPELGFVDAVSQRIVELVNVETRNHPTALTAASDLMRGLLQHLQIQAAHPAMQDQTRKQTHRQCMLDIAARMRDERMDCPTVSELARQTGYSTTHFHDLFKAVHGIGPQALMIHARIERAMQWLIESDQSVSQIAQQLGYRDVFFFSRQFKARTGLSPMQYRRQQMTP